MNLHDYKLWTAIITPMNQDGSVDYKSFESLLRVQEEAGNGVLLIGSTGEGLALDQSDREEIVNFACEKNLSVPLMVGVGGANLNSQLSWVEYCNTKNIHGYLLVTPLYAKPGAKGQEAWFRALLDKSTKPCMLYNVPGRAGTSLNRDALRNLNSHQNFWSIKEASGSLEELAAYRETCPNKDIYCGDDGLMGYFATGGACGLVSVASNVWAKETKEYVTRCLSGKHEGLYPLWDKAAGSLFIASNPIPVKVLMNKVGMIANSSLRAPLTHEEVENLDTLLSAHEAVQAWFRA